MKIKLGLVFLLLLACCVKLPPPVSIQNDFVLDTNFDKAWETAIDVITQNNLPIKAIAKDSGVLVTDFAAIGSKPSIEVRLNNVTDLSSSLTAWENGRYYLNFLIRKKADKQVSVRIQAHIEALAGFVSRQAYVLPSNGTLEMYFFSELQKKTGYSGIGVIVEESTAILGKEAPPNSSNRIKMFMTDSKKSIREEKQRGLRITNLTENSPAEKASLMLNDLIVEIDGSKTETQFDSYRLIGKEGSKIKLRILRDGVYKNFELVREKIAL